MGAPLLTAFPLHGRDREASHSRDTDMKMELHLLLPFLVAGVTANQPRYNYDNYEPAYTQQQQVDRYDTAQYQPEVPSYQPDRYDTIPYQPSSYDTPYQPSSYDTPYQPAVPYQPQEEVHPAHYHQEEEKYPPKPFAYEYGGADESGRHFAKTETSDDDGVVRGEYRVELPDGRVQIVSYTADHVNGYQADVRYEGEARPYVPEEQWYDEPRQKYVPQHKPYARRY